VFFRKTDLPTSSRPALSVVEWAQDKIQLLAGFHFAFFMVGSFAAAFAKLL